MVRPSLLPRVRLAAGLFCVLGACLAPFVVERLADVWQQIVTLGMLSAAALLWGVGVAPAGVWIAVVMAGVAMAFTPNPYPGQMVAGMAGVALAGVACHLGAGLRRRPQALSWVLFALVAAAVLNALEGLLQWFGLVGELYRWVMETDRRGMAFGALRQTNLFATLLCIGAVCTVWLFQRRQLTVFMAWFISMILMWGVAASGSRTGVMEVGAIAMLGLFWWQQQAPAVTRLMLGQVLMLLLAMLLLPWLAELHGFGFSSGLERAARSGGDGRLTIWANAIGLIAEHPWLGWGWRDLSYGRYVTLFPHRFDGLLEHAHNLPLQLAVEFGLPLTLLMCGLVLRGVWVAKPWRVPPQVNDQASPLASGQHFAWTILLLIGIHSLLEYPLWYALFLFIAGLFVGYVIPLPRAPVSDKTWTRHVASVVAAALIGLAMMASHQYETVLPVYKIPFTNDREVQRKAGRIALDGATGAWLFRGHRDFAELGLTDVTIDNAVDVRQRAENLLHHSAEPRVIQPLLFSLWLLQDLPALRFHAERFCRAFPETFERWLTFYAGQPIVAALGSLPATCLVAAGYEKKASP